MNEDKLLDRLLDPDDDHAWKVAVGGAIYEIRDQAQRTNGRVSSLELWRAAMAGGLLVVSAVIVPLFLKLVLE